MNKPIRITLGLFTVVALVIVIKYFSDANSESIIDYDTQTPFYTSLNTNVVATGKLNPEDEQETELYAVHISPVTYALINAGKELNAKVEALEARIQTLEGN